jgi:hypothetical protein
MPLAWLSNGQPVTTANGAATEIGTKTAHFPLPALDTVRSRRLTRGGEANEAIDLRAVAGR